MKKLLCCALVLQGLFVFQVHGGDAFRLENGDLVQAGMKKGEVLAKLGKAEMKDVVRRTGVNTEKMEVWTYFTKDTFGTPVVLTITFVGESATTIDAKQKR